MSTDGFDIKLLIHKTGLGESKIKMLLQRHPELRGKPYSVKAAGRRIFLPKFVDWLKKYEGAEVQSHESHTSVTSVTSDQIQLSGSQLREYRLMAKDKLITKEQLHQIIGLSPTPQSGISKPITLMIPEPVSREEGVARVIARNIVARRGRRIEDDEKQHRLFEASRNMKELS